MLKRLFRLAIILILLVGLSHYTSIFDNTKIKPYLQRVEDLVTSTVSHTGEIQKVDQSSGEIDNPKSLTGSDSFGSDDIIEGGEVLDSGSIMSGKKEILQSGLQLRVKNCLSPWGKFVPNNSYIIAYKDRQSLDCKREKRYCVDGGLDGSFQYDTCYYSTTITKQKENATFTIGEFEQFKNDYNFEEVSPEDIDIVLSGGTSIGVGVIIGSKNSQAIDSAINSQLVGYKNGIKVYGYAFTKTTNDPERHFIGNPTRGIALLSNKQTEINNSVLKSNALKKQLEGYYGKTFITDQKSLTSSLGYSSKICSTPRGTVMSNGQFVVAFKSGSLENDVCEAETRYCIDGTLQGSFTYQDCQ